MKFVSQFRQKAQCDSGGLERNMGAGRFENRDVESRQGCGRIGTRPNRGAREARQLSSAGLLPGGALGTVTGFHAALQNVDRLLGATGAGHLELLTALLVVGDEELLDLVEQRLADIANRFEIWMIVGVNGDAQKPVVTFGLAILSLRVEGRKPKSKGNIMPSGKRPPSLNSSVSGS